MITDKIPCSAIDADPSFNVCRGNLTPADCNELAASIAVHGLQFPVLVRPVVDGYELVSGFRRFMAVSVNLGHETIDCIVREMTREEALVLNVVENLQRSDLSFWEQCRAVRAAFPEDTPQTEIAKALSCSRTWVKKRTQLWKLPESILLQIEAGMLSPAQVDVIIQQSTEAEQIQAATKLKAGQAAGETVRDLQRELTGRKNSRSKNQVKAVMSKLIESGREADEAAMQGMRFSIGEISDTLLFQLLDKLCNSE